MSTWISKHHEAGALGAGAGLGVVDLARAEAREKGRATPRLLYCSERGLAMSERRVADWLDLGGGERPAGLMMGADLGVVIEIFEGVERTGEMLMRVERAMRDVLTGLDALLSSSSSKVRLRFVEKLAGLIFSESASMKIELFILFIGVGFTDMAPGYNCELDHFGNIKTWVITYHFAGSDD